MKTIRFSIVTLFICITTLPLVVQAEDDENISQYAVNIEDKTLGALSSYSLAFTTVADLSDAETLSILFLKESSPESGIDFSLASLGPSTFDASGSFSVDYIYNIDLDENLPAGEHSIIVNNVQNPSEATCVEPLITSYDVDGSVPATGADRIAFGNAVNCVSESEELDTMSNISQEVFGRSIFLTWDAYTDAAYYAIRYGTNQDLTDVDTTTIETTNIQYVLHNLSKETTYYFDVAAYDANDIQLTEDDVLSALTGSKNIKKIKAIDKINKIVKRQVRSAVVKWSMPSQAQDFIDNYQVKLKNHATNKVIKVYKNIPSTTFKKLLKKLKSEHKYTVQARAMYDINGTNRPTRWSDPSNFTTKSE